MSVSNNILSLIENTPNAIIGGIAGRVRLRRLEAGFTQKELAGRAGLPLPTYRRFERKSEISLRGLVMLGMALGMTDEFDALFSANTYGSLDELLKKQGNTRKRGKKNKPTQF